MLNPRNLGGSKFVTIAMTRLRACSFILLLLFIPCGYAQQSSDAGQVQVLENQYDLAGSGKVFLSDEAQRASFFLLGELHGENEIPSLLR
jgi:hypothetical protein